MAMAQWFFKVPKCELDKWSRRFLARFSTVPLLPSKMARAVLLCLGVMARWEILRMECRHDILRKLIKARDAWHTDFGETMLLMRSRLADFLHRRRRGDDVSSKRRRRIDRGSSKWRRFREGKYKGQPTGGGGTRCALVGLFLGGTRYATSEERKANFVEARAKAKAAESSGGGTLEQARAQGQAVTLTRAVGGAASGGRKARLRKLRCAQAATQPANGKRLRPSGECEESQPHLPQPAAAPRSLAPTVGNGLGEQDSEEELVAQQLAVPERADSAVALATPTSVEPRDNATNEQARAKV